MIDGKLLLFLLWIDDCLIIGQEEHVTKEVKRFCTLYETTDKIPDGNLTEYVGCRVERTKSFIRLTQPTKIRRFKD